LKHLIVTACDAKYGGFLVDHFLRSLTDNVNLSNIDIVVLDYGLTETQVHKVWAQGVRTVKCEKDCHVVNARFRDMTGILDETKYDQVMAIDGGDVIFQADISDAFETDKDQIRITPEHLRLSLNDFFVSALTPSSMRKAKGLLKNKLSLNCGVMIGPCKLMKELASEVYSIIIKKDQFGPDQVAVNYILYRDGFADLAPRFNFMPTSTSEMFYIDNGVFYLPDGLPIPIVHNAGGTGAFRAIHNFGYGQEHNKVKGLILAVFRATFNKSTNGYNEINSL